MTDEETRITEGEEGEGGEEEEVPGLSDDLQILNERLGTPISDDSDVIEPLEEEGEVPTEANTVVEIKAFLDEAGVEYPSGASKAELLELV